MTSIVLLTHDGGQKLGMCLRSLQAHTQDYELVAVDNGSSDGSGDLLRRFPGPTTLVSNDENLGCPAGRAQALCLAQGDPVVMLDDDVVLTSGWLDALKAHLSVEPCLGVLGPVTNRISGAQQVETDGYVDVAGLERFALGVLAAGVGRLADAPRLMGFCMVVRCAVIDQIGGFDGSFGRYGFEDDDFCWRARLAGWRLGIAGDVFVHHHGSLGGLRGAEFDQALAGAWLRFRAKWRLPQSLSFQQYAELCHEFRLTRPFDPGRDHVPLGDASCIAGKIERH